LHNVDVSRNSLDCNKQNSLSESAIYGQVMDFYN